MSDIYKRFPDFEETRGRTGKQAIWLRAQWFWRMLLLGGRGDALYLRWRFKENSNAPQPKGNENGFCART